MDLRRWVIGGNEFVERRGAGIERDGRRGGGVDNEAVVDVGEGGAECECGVGFYFWVRSGLRAGWDAAVVDWEVGGGAEGYFCAFDCWETAQVEIAIIVR